MAMSLSSMQRQWIYALSAIALLATCLIYWPTIHFNFVWDDWLSFHDTPWLTQGDQWRHYMLRGFNNWQFYFRPLVVGFFALQVRLFDGLPGPMHATSLALHLIDVSLVGALAWRCIRASGMETTRRAWLVPLSMAIYGLHPVLIETVAWVGCQFELILILLTLVGLIANVSIRNPWLRAASITPIFFLAACAKEAALSFPLLLALFDWTLFSGGAEQPFVASITGVLRRNWPTYLGMVLAGIGYLAFRHWALGSVTSHFLSASSSPMGHLWEVSTVYLHYVKMLVWPVSEMGPIHPYDPEMFQGAAPPGSLFGIAITFIIAGSGLYLTIRDKSVAGAMIVGATVALLPVLRIIPVAFDLSLYHERYVSLSLAILCTMLPLIRQPDWLKAAGRQTVVRSMAVILTFFWLTFSVLAIRGLLPNWRSDPALWEWALASHPHEAFAKLNLLTAYARIRDDQAALKLGDKIVADPASCDKCMLRIAELAILQHAPSRAAAALERARQSPMMAKNKAMLHEYYLLTGRMLAQQGKLKDAEEVLQAASALAPQDVETTHALRLVQSLRGQTTRANQ
ncbi:tetratricopeptide repeat protein [Dyella telluris]|uniref:Tetratricopeptide repeat protein n=1 Tax=Dyella telluris TaxID=2763498 RepID=A0A7G8Q0S3_9GAMM|nr:hypothetical protein [Dyella telluris]QNK00381.1 hypothetical protein H8F01_14845 [Dyella telluris]